MELSSLVSAASSTDTNTPGAAGASKQTAPNHINFFKEVDYSARRGRDSIMEFAPPPVRATNGVKPSISGRPDPKNVIFELVSAESPQYRARLPMRVQIFPHDTTESIVTTVKNFYGLYSSPTSSKGVSFEDEQGNTLIARYENFASNMTVYVRVNEEPITSPPSFNAHAFHPTPVPAQAFLNGDAYPLQAPQQFAQHISRPGSRTSRRRSLSPNSGRGRRSTSVSTNPKARSRSSKQRGPGSQGGADGDSMNGYSSGDGAPGSISGKSKEHIGNTEISVENIVEGGRRKRAKFESSELPLFAPPQMPAATSNPSVSPARRMDHHRASLPFVHPLLPGQNPFIHPRPLQSPQTYTNSFGHSGVYATPVTDARRTRASIGYPTGIGIGPGMGILPTPDPTVGSCMSEEDKDVAMQLMRLGDVSNISHGRTSASTQDDTFSGRADAASSTGATSDAESESEEEDLPPARKQRLDLDGNSKKVYPSTETHFVPVRDGGEVSGDDADSEDGNEEGAMGAPKLKKIKPIALPGAKARSLPPASKTKTQKSNKVKQSSNGTKAKKAGSISSVPMSPTSLPASRKPSVASNVAFPTLAGEDEQPDLSSKPRCQRCRKSKKGCDRQRPCGRCKDAGLPAELCISEDEGNGRKGRYGRHMGVPVKQTELAGPPALLPAAPIATAVAFAITAADKNKKRKR